MRPRGRSYARRPAWPASSKSVPIPARGHCSPHCRSLPQRRRRGRPSSTQRFRRRREMAFATCAFSPPGIRAMANGRWREWHFRNRQHAENRDSDDINQEVKPVSNVHRKHPVSIAVHLALLAAVATSAMASPHTGAAAENPGPQASTPQDAVTTPSPPPKKDDAATTPAELSTVTVVGVRASQERAIELKRLAPNIRDSISAESIGQLP